MVKNMKNPQKNLKFLKNFWPKKKNFFWKSRFLVDFTPETPVSMGGVSLYGGGLTLYKKNIYPPPKKKGPFLGEGSGMKLCHLDKLGSNSPAQVYVVENGLIRDFWTQS